VAASHILHDPKDLDGGTSTFVTVDDKQAKDFLAKLVYDLGIQPGDAPPLRQAREIEAWTSRWCMPPVQKRKQGFEMGALPGNHCCCIGEDDWYEPVLKKTVGRPSPSPLWLRTS